MGTFSKYELNTFNFIRWRSATSVTTSNIGTATLATGSTAHYPNAYIMDENIYIPKMVLDSEISIYANLTTAATDVDFANWTCAFADRFGTINSAHGTFSVTKDDFGSGNFRWYFAVTPATGDFADGEYYRFVIYNTSTSAVKYVSNFMEARPATESGDYSYISYRNASSLDNFNYTDLTSFRNKIFLDLNLVNNQPEIEQSDYSEVTTGDMRVSKTYKKLVLSFEAKQFDEEAQRAMESAYSCSDILINTKTVRRKEAPEWSVNRRSRLADGTMAFYDKAVSTINLNGYDG